MAYREVTRVETKEVLRQWVGGRLQARRGAARVGCEDGASLRACGPGTGAHT
jgi:hypothetical protein